MLTPTVRKGASFLLYPLLLGGALLLWSSLWLGVGWDADMSMQLVYWLFLAVLVVLERLLPFEPAWNRNDGQLRNDIVLSILTIALNSLATIVCLGAIAWAITRIEPLVSLQVWPAHWPLYVQIIPGIVLWDLGNHLAHRWAHKVPLLWRFHSVHHSAPRLSVINAGRFHPIDIVKSVVIGSPIPILLGVPADTPLVLGGSDGPALVTWAGQPGKLAVRVRVQYEIFSCSQCGAMTVDRFVRRRSLSMFA